MTDMQRAEYSHQSCVYMIHDNMIISNSSLTSLGKYPTVRYYPCLEPHAAVRDSNTTHGLSWASALVEMSISPAVYAAVDGGGGYNHSCEGNHSMASCSTAASCVPCHSIDIRQLQWDLQPGLRPIGARHGICQPDGSDGTPITSLSCSIEHAACAAAAEYL